MKSVLMSIQPKWCELIASGKKTVEIRKTRPKTDVPFKCYIYQTKLRWVYTLLHALGFFAIARRLGRGTGKVIGEFVCDRIIRYEMEGYGKDLNLYQSIKAVRLDEDGEELWFTIATNEMTKAELSKVHLLNKSCLSFDQIGSYVVGNKMFGFHSFYGWHISDLVIYDEPKGLHHFFKPCGNCDKKGTRRCTEELTDCRAKVIERPPQSWCYVQKGGAE